MILLDNLFQETYISDIVKRNKKSEMLRNGIVIDVLASALVL